MAQYVTKIRTESGDKQIDYNALANLPQSDATLTQTGSFADAKATGDAIKAAKSDLTTQINNTKAEVTTQINTTKEELTTQMNTTKNEVTNQITNITNNVTNLTAADVHALPDTYVAPVTSVNGKTGDVTVKVGVAGATEGHLPVFNANGDIVSSGKSLWDFTRATMSLSGTTLTITTVS